MAVSCWIQVLVAFVYGNLLEWLVHKYVLHGWGRARRGYWAYHWHTHHANVRRHGLVDPDYVTGRLSCEQRAKETLGIWAAALAHAWLIRNALPWAAGAILGYAWLYLYCHEKSHRDAAWARRWLPWHCDHHENRDPDQNWCLTFPLWDWILGTRIRER